MPQVKEIRGLPGAEKAAIMVLTMGEERASRIFAMMDDEEIREISQNMVNLGAVDSTVIESLLVEFVSMISGTGAIQGTYESNTRPLMKRLVKDRVGQNMDELGCPAGPATRNAALGLTRAAGRQTGRATAPTSRPGPRYTTCPAGVGGSRSTPSLRP